MNSFKKFAIFAFVCLLMSDELVRKMLGGNPIITVAKDVVVIAIILMSGRKIIKDFAASPFFVFCLFALASSVFVFAGGGGMMHLIISAKAFALFPVYYLLGREIYDSGLTQFFMKTLLIIGSLSLLLGVLQVHAPGALPDFALQRTFIERHSAADQSYVEGTFSSPQTFALVALFVFVIAISGVKLSRGPFYSLLHWGIIFLSLYAVYISRIRGAIVLLLLILGGYVFSRYKKLQPVLLVAGLGLVPFLASDAPSESELKPDQFTASSFYGEALDSNAILERGVSAVRVQNDPDYIVLGYGAGTSMTPRSYLENEDEYPIPLYDSGISNSMFQFGLLGSILLFGPIILLHIKNRSALKSDNKLHMLLFLYSTSMWVWCLFKHFSVFVNPTTGALIFLTIGLCVEISSANKTYRRSKVIAHGALYREPGPTERSFRPKRPQ